ncbi:unnamed protein product [Closterium sp. NIES-53]
MSRDSGISRKSLSEWKLRKGEMEGAHGARKRLHGRGRASWYRDMEIEVYSRVLAHRKRCLAVSIGRLQKWSHKVMKILHPEVKWAGSQRWTGRFRRRWNLTTRAKTRIGQKLSSERSRVRIPVYAHEWFESEGVDCLTERGELNPYVYDVSALDCFHPVLIDVLFPCMAGNIRKPPPELTLKWISKAWKAVPKELIERSFLTCGISNALHGSRDNLCMQHRRDAVKGEVELDDEIAADGFCCNNVEEPESDGEADQDGSATVDGDAWDV